MSQGFKLFVVDQLNLLELLHLCLFLQDHLSALETLLDLLPHGREVTGSVGKASFFIVDCR
jgi:hypothetical protein